MIDTAKLFHSNRGTLRQTLSVEDKVKFLERIYNFLKKNIDVDGRPITHRHESPYLIFIPEGRRMLSRIPHLLAHPSFHNNTYINNQFSQFFYTMYDTTEIKDYIPIQCALLSRRVDHPLYKLPRYPYFQKSVQRPCPENKSFEHVSSPFSSYNRNCVFSLTADEARVFAPFLTPGFINQLEPIPNLNDLKGL